ncbi:hypothetical protein INS49_004155 [Diaporthe citri]|uniref:uncharacterized protein n=1 Tax=Diaporthe citri TaxID=83186 RepID=UPI001C7F2590|nr:uncharacterized protein INS49_004155 [Diaporthe citri]KAG6355074.1 hypothetical protein INS49_004155 [Diaporthe citri]
MTGDPETWFAHQWAQQIGRHYANREAAENGRPKAQTKTREQIALLEYAFATTFGYPYTGEVLSLAILTGLQVKQVKSWFENQRKKRAEDNDLLALQQPEIFGMRGQETKDAAAMVRQYNKDPKGYARSLVMWDRCVRTGQPGPFEELQCPRPYFKKYWTRMFPEDGHERSLLEVTQELEDSDDDSMANLTEEEINDMSVQSEIEERQYKRNQEELEAQDENEK